MSKLSRGVFGKIFSAKSNAIDKLAQAHSRKVGNVLSRILTVKALTPSYDLASGGTGFDKQQRIYLDELHTSRERALKEAAAVGAAADYAADGLALSGRKSVETGRFIRNKKVRKFKPPSASSEAIVSVGDNFLGVDGTETLSALLATIETMMGQAIAIKIENPVLNDYGKYVEYGTGVFSRGGKLLSRVARRMRSIKSGKKGVTRG